MSILSLPSKKARQSYVNGVRRIRKSLTTTQGLGPEQSERLSLLLRTRGKYSNSLIQAYNSAFTALTRYGIGSFVLSRPVDISLIIALKLDLEYALGVLLKSSVSEQNGTVRVTVRILTAAS